MESHVFPFLKLPGEVRNEIYRLLLVHDRPVRVPCDFDRPSDPEARSLQILRLCRQVFEEASPIFYVENFFDLHPGLLRNFGITLWDCPVGYQQHVRKISIRLDDQFKLACLYHDFSNPFKQFVHLDEIKVHYRVPYFDKEDVRKSDVLETFKKWLRCGRSIVGRILAEMPLVDIWLVEHQILMLNRRASSVSLGESEKAEDASHGDDSNDKISEKSASQPPQNIEDKATDELSDDDGRRIGMDSSVDGKLLYKQRVISRKAILDPDPEQPWSVLLVPGPVEEWRYVPWEESWPHKWLQVY